MVCRAHDDPFSFLMMLGGAPPLFTERYRPGTRLLFFRVSSSLQRLPSSRFRSSAACSGFSFTYDKGLSRMIWQCFRCSHCHVPSIPQLSARLFQCRLSTSRRGAREIRPRHSLSRAQHRTAPYIYTRTHFNTSPPLPDSFPFEFFSAAFVFPSLFVYFSNTIFVSRFTGLSLFLSVWLSLSNPFTVSLYFYLYLFLSLFPPLSPSLSVSLSLSLSPTGRKPHRPPFSPAPFLLLVRMVN